VDVSEEKKKKKVAPFEEKKKKGKGWGEKRAKKKKRKRELLDARGGRKGREPHRSRKREKGSVSREK